jgi:hypothetical protein
MPNSIKWKSKVLLAKIEGTYGVDATPTGVANAILATNVELTPMDGDDVSRDLEFPYPGAQATIPTALRTVIAFDTEIAGSGTAGVAPKWGPLARACGMAEVTVADTSVTYNPISGTMESLSFYFWIGSTRYIFKGARGGGVVGLTAQGVPRIRWTFMGLFTLPAEAAPATPTLAGFIKPKLVTHANTPSFTVNGVSLVMRSYSLNLGCDVQPRLLIGREEILIVDRAETLDVVVEATPLTTIDPFALANAQTLVPVTIVHGTVAGNIATIAAPTCQVKRPTGLQNNQGVKEWPLSLTPLPSAAGNDQFSIALT